MKTDAELVAEYGIIPGSAIAIDPAKPVRPDGHPIAELSEAEFKELLGKRKTLTQFAAFACVVCGKPQWRGTGDLQWVSPQCSSKHPAKGTQFRGCKGCEATARAKLVAPTA